MLSTTRNIIHLRAYEGIFPNLLLKCLFTNALNARYAVRAARGTFAARIISGCENEYLHSKPGLVPNVVHSSCTVIDLKDLNDLFGINV